MRWLGGIGMQLQAIETFTFQLIAAYTLMRSFIA